MLRNTENPYVSKSSAVIDCELKPAVGKDHQYLGKWDSVKSATRVLKMNFILFVFVQTMSICERNI